MVTFSVNLLLVALILIMSGCASHESEMVESAFGISAVSLELGEYEKTALLKNSQVNEWLTVHVNDGTGVINGKIRQQGNEARKLAKPSFKIER